MEDSRMNEKIWFSIIICCYNSEKYLKHTLESVINQSYKFWELIIIDDGSTDKTKPIIDKYKTKNSKIKYFYQSNKGFASARNFEPLKTDIITEILGSLFIVL